MLQPHKVEIFKVEDLATRFCGEVVFVPKCIIVFFQFIVNSVFGYNLSVVISIYYSELIRVAPWFFPLHWNVFHVIS